MFTTTRYINRNISSSINLSSNIRLLSNRFRLLSTNNNNYDKFEENEIPFASPFDNSTFAGYDLHPPSSLILPLPPLLPLPTGLSPSSIIEFRSCPQSFLLRYVLKIREPTTPVLTKGTMVHAALEKVFELKRGERTLENLHNLLRLEWSQAKTDNESTYGSLFGTREEEREWGLSALSLLDNYWDIEDPSSLPSDPVFRERWVRANINDGEEGEFNVRGIIDRMDLVRVQGDEDAVGAICDYKTGKAPDLKYSKATNERIREDKFFQLKIYALLMREMNRGRKDGQMVSDQFNSTKTETDDMTVRVLRLMFLTNKLGKAEVLEYDLGSTISERDEKLDDVAEELKCVWREVKGLVETNDSTMFKHCDRKFCSCHKARRVFSGGLTDDMVEKRW